MNVHLLVDLSITKKQTLVTYKVPYPRKTEHISMYEPLLVDRIPSLAPSPSFALFLSACPIMAPVPSTMRALRATRSNASAPPSLSLQTIPIPSPGPGELLLRIRASAIQPADILNSQGGFPHTTFPRTLGKDFAGTVVSGPDEWMGKDVYGTSGSTLSFTTDGAHAEYAVVPADGVVEMPRGMAFAQAGGLGTVWGTAAMALQRAEARGTDVVLVLGATGQVGSAVVQVAKEMGCTVIGVGRKGTDISSISDPTLESAKEITGGRGPDVVIDTVGDLSLTRAAFEILAVKGRMSIITAPRQGNTEISLDVKSLYRRQVKVVGVNTAGVGMEEMAEVLGGLREGFERGALVPPGEEGKRAVGIEDAVKAYEERWKGALIVVNE